MSQVNFTHLRVELRGATVAGQVWDEGDLVPLDGSTPDPVNPLVIEKAAEGEHPMFTAGRVVRGEFKPIKTSAAAKASTPEADLEPVPEPADAEGK